MKIKLVHKFEDIISLDNLLSAWQEFIPDKDIIWLLQDIIESYKEKDGVGLPLGNLTSQLFANVYMNIFDQWVKHKLKTKLSQTCTNVQICDKCYIRYADDFVFLSADKNHLKNILPEIDNFLNSKLKLTLHPNKIFIKTASSGVDFLGWVNFPDYRILRKTTKKRMFRRISDNPKSETIQSYLGLLKHGNMGKIRDKIQMYVWLNGN